VGDRAPKRVNANRSKRARDNNRDGCYGNVGDDSRDLARQRTREADAELARERLRRGEDALYLPEDWVPER
jgi:hypothetical protein